MIKKFSIILVALTVLTLGAGLVLPRTWRVERHVVINAPPERIHPLLFDLKRWQEWSLWTRAMDPLLRNTYEGPQDGVGAKWLWLGPTMGRGQIVITASDPQHGIELDESIESEVVNARASFAFTSEGDATRVTWVDEGTLPLVAGGFFRGTLEEKLGAHLAASLERLKAVVEAQAPTNSTGSP